MEHDAYVDWENDGRNLLHTPGGVRDIYGAECANKLKIQSAIRKVFLSHGFRDIQTPTFEYFDVFSKERGTAASKDMFKFFDRGNNTLVLRPDMTPSIARCAAKYYKDEDMQIRLCYIANTFINTDRYKGKLQEATQAGAELFNDSSSDADAEMISMTAECLLKSGLKEFQIEAGHADFFPALVEEAGFLEEDAKALRKLIESKNFFGVEDLLKDLDAPRELKEIFLSLHRLHGSLGESMEYIRRRSKSARVKQALERLCEIESIVKMYGFGEYITVDLSMLSNYSYYTGVVFKAYTYGNGEAVATGGRYDGLAGQFGKDAPAIGLAVAIDQLMPALSRQNLLNENTLSGIILLFSEENRKLAIECAADLRNGGGSVRLVRKSPERALKDYEEYARRVGAEKIIEFVGENDVREIKI